jgi:putative ABC transport system permease protein
VRALRIKLIRDLRALRIQGLSIALVVASGVAAYVASMSTHESLKLARDRHYVTTLFPEVFVELTRAPISLAQDLRAHPGIALLRQGLAHHARLEIDGIDDALSAQVMNLPEPEDPGKLTLLAGRWPEPGSREVLLGESLAEKRSLSPGQPLRLTINGRVETLIVSGLVSSPEFILGAAHGGMSDDRSFGLVWMDRERLAAAIDLRDSFNTMALTLDRSAQRAEVIAELDRRLARYGGRGAYGREDQFSNRALNQEIAEQWVFATVLPVIFLGVSVFVLHSVLGRRVSIERAQIATLRALGYSAMSLGWHYLLIGVLIAASGAALGIAVGAQLGRWLTALYAQYFRFPAFAWELTVEVAAVPVIAVTLGAALAAALAVRAVLRCSPAEAMQPASQPSGHRGLLAGSGRRADPIRLMIARTVLMRPLRSLFTLLGIAGSVAILISGSWWRDAIDHLLRVQFELAMPADSYLALQPPVAASARAELLRLPGVVSAELRRSVPVRLHGPGGSERTRLEGFGVSDTLRQPMAVDGRAGSPPLSGLLLPLRLSEALGVIPGDRVTIEFLEGRQRQRDVAVEAVIAEPMGRSAYIDPDGLTRLSGEPARFDQAALQVESGREQALVAALREQPVVVASFRKAELLARIRESSRRNMLVFSAVLTVFAAAITVGVIYNSARIALSERRWELATLRVLGMTEAEVARLLLGELALQTLLAMPIGAVAGLALAHLLVSMMSDGQFTIPVIVLPRTYAWAIASTLATGLISAALVRRRLARLDLIGVLKIRE